MRDSQGRRDEASEIADDAAAQSEQDGVAGASLFEQPVLDLGLGLARLGAFAGRQEVREEALARKTALKVVEIERSDVGVGDEDIAGRGAGFKQRVADVFDEPEANVDAVFAQDGHALDSRRHRVRR